MEQHKTFELDLVRSITSPTQEINLTDHYYRKQDSNCWIAKKIFIKPASPAFISEKFLFPIIQRNPVVQLSETTYHEYRYQGRDETEASIMAQIHPQPLMPSDDPLFEKELCQRLALFGHELAAGRVGKGSRTIMWFMNRDTPQGVTLADFSGPQNPDPRFVLSTSRLFEIPLGSNVMSITHYFWIKQ